jgi:hypothetical protein
LAEALAKNRMNKALKLLDENFVLELLRKEVLPQYPYFTYLNKVIVRPYKKFIWETTYHVVISWEAYFSTKNGAEVKLPIFCSAHSNEKRENIYEVLKYLWENNFPDSNFKLPRPLFYSREFNGTFYRGLRGENLLYYIKKCDRPEIKKIIKESAALFYKLHNLKIDSKADFNPLNAHINTVIPGVDNILKEVGARYHGNYVADLRQIYDYLIGMEERYFLSGAKLSLIHGDAHPENIIKTNENKIGLVDFTDVCLSDFARDLGSFMQQLEYKITSKAGDYEFAQEMKKLFLDTYLKISGLEFNSDLENRVKLYYNFTAIRTAAFFFLKDGHDEERGMTLIKKVKEDLNLK